MFWFDCQNRTEHSSNYFFVSGAARRGALSQRHKGGRPSGRRLKIASIGSAAAGTAPVLCALLYSVGESGALPCMGQIRSPQFLGKLLAVYAPENAGLFLVWLTIVQRIKLQNVCNRIGESCERLCVLRAPLKLILKHYFS